MAIGSEKVTIIIRVYILLCNKQYKLVYPALVPLSGHPMKNIIAKDREEVVNDNSI